ncbi:MAG: MscL family protein [Candidatus Moraniibacteriota bacterium]
MIFREHMSGFMEFIRKQGVVSVAIGFVLAGAVAKMVSALVTDIINPLIGLVLVNAENLKLAKFAIGNVNILWGDFVSTMIDFVIIALVVYFSVKLLGVEMPEKKK